MKLLILTQKVDATDSVLGFFHSWIIEFAKHFETVTVICLWKGTYDLPENVRVFSLGKERGVSKLTYVFNFYRYIWQERNQYDRVFVHMNQVYVVLGGLVWKILGKKISLWYTHRQTSFLLWIAEKFADTIFTSSKESFRIPSTKVNFMGHGIKVADFDCGKDVNARKNDGPVTIVTIGRITRIKNCDVLFQAAALLKKEWSRPFKILLVGAPVTIDDIAHFEELRALAKKLELESNIVFEGAIPSNQIPSFYCKADLTVNLSPTGGTDKVVLESIASKTPTFVSNKAFGPLFGDYAGIFMPAEGNAEDLARKIMQFFEMDQNKKGSALAYLKARVAANFGLEGLIKKIVTLSA